MNIFAVESNPIDAAQALVDKHVVKMILETAQLLSTAHRVIDGEEYIDDSGKRKVKRWLLPDDREIHLYSATHVNHPSAVWCRLTNNNYNWLYCHFVALLQEYTYRYDKAHKCSTLITWLMDPPKLIDIGWKTEIPLAMPDEYKTVSTLESYRNYYRHGKTHLHKWTKRQPPKWISK